MTAESSSLPPLPETPWEALGELQRDEVLLEGRSFLIRRPADYDMLLDHPAVRAALAAADYLPYWAELWPAARMLAKFLLKHSWPARLHAIEIGCGLGLPGIAALACGMRVTFTDYDATAVRLAAENARLNGFTAFTSTVLDWRHPPAGLQAAVLLASDLIYEARNVEPLVDLIARLLAPGGVCLLTDQDRVPRALLRQTLAERALPFTTRALRAGQPGETRYKGTLYRITHRAGSTLAPP
jgi:predicted nicotinamide N-methyase